MNRQSWRGTVAAVTIALSAFGITSPVTAANILVNGGFEDGLNNWTFTGDGINDTASLSSDTPTGIGMSADLDINAGNGLPWLIQDVDVLPGDELTFTASVKELVPSNPDAWIAGQVWLLPDANGGILTSAALFFTNPEWETQSTTITVPANATVARVLFTPQNTSFLVGTGQYLIDDVRLDSSIIPEPASLALSGCAMLLGLAMARAGVFGLPGNRC